VRGSNNEEDFVDFGENGRFRKENKPVPILRRCLNVNRKKAKNCCFSN
jgi:hypothetical protein